jgi:hypothetical protein
VNSSPAAAHTPERAGPFRTRRPRPNARTQPLLLWLTGPTIGARNVRLEGKAPPFSMQTTALEPLLPRTVTPPFRLRQDATPKKPRRWETMLRARGREERRSRCAHGARARANDARPRSRGGSPTRTEATGLKREKREGRDQRLRL